ncbi:MAG: hypothetical protein Q9173_003565 [Seirophora scorigena]
MLNKQALAALAACIALLPHVFAADILKKSRMGFCKEGTCNPDEYGCPAAITASGSGYPECVIYNTEDVLDVTGFEAAEGGGTQVFLDIEDPEGDCAYIVKSPASTQEVACGVTVGSFRNAVCTSLVLKETFIIQHCCGDSCEEAGVGAKMIRGMDYKKRGLSSRGVTIVGEDGKIIPPKEEGYPPQRKRSLPPPPPAKLFPRKGSDTKSSDDVKCDDDYKGEYYTRPDNVVQIVATGMDGGTTGAEVEITEERTVTESITMSAGFDLEIISASMEMTFEKSITNGKAKTWTIPAGQSGKVGFTPTLRCTRGEMTCDGEKSEGEVCSGYEEAGEIAGTYAVIATS